MTIKIFINSVPKSGTHLLARCLALNGYSHSPKTFIAADWVVSGSHVKSVIKRILRGGLWGKSLVRVGVDTSAFVSQNTLRKLLTKNNSLGKTYILGHAPYSDLLFNELAEQKIKTIFIIRDPRDVLVSWAHSVNSSKGHFAESTSANKQFDDHVRRILIGGYLDSGVYVEGFSSILRDAQGWLSARGVLAVRFEDLVGSCGGGDDKLQKETISKIVEFIGGDKGQEDDVAAKLFGESKTFRTGKIGSWRSELSPDLLRLTEESISNFLPIYGVAVCSDVIQKLSPPPSCQLHNLHQA